MRPLIDTWPPGVEEAPTTRRARSCSGCLKQVRLHLIYGLPPLPSTSALGVCVLVLVDCWCVGYSVCVFVFCVWSVLVSCVVQLFSGEDMRVCGFVGFCVFRCVPLLSFALGGVGGWWVVVVVGC